MHRKKTKFIGALTVTLTVVGILLLLFWLPQHLQQIITFTIEHPVLAPLIIIVWRFLAVVIPPLPGGIFSIALIPVFGWFWSYIFGMIGLLSGVALSFFIARRFREPVVAHFVPLQQLHMWEGKLSKKTEFLAFLGIRMTTGPVMDFISYIAGLSKINFRTFFLATIISELPNAVLYYIGGETYKALAAQGVTLALGVLFLVSFLLYSFLNKSLEKRKAKK